MLVTVMFVATKGDEITKTRAKNRFEAALV
jgi:hypothetical protein